MRGTVKFFDTMRGWGFITDTEYKDHFIHCSSIVMDGRKQLSEGDIVEFEVGQGANGKEQAVNVTPILTMQMIEKALKDEGLRVKQIIDQYGLKQYIVINSDDMMQSPEYGMDLVELAAYAGIDVSGLEEHEEDNKIMMNREQAIDKIMEEYSKHGVERCLVEKMYDSAIQNDVSNELIYPGMKLMINNALGIDNTDVIKEVGEGFTEFAVNDTRQANPTATDKDIARNMEEELIDGFDWEALEASAEITDAIKESAEKFIENNK